MTAFFVLVFFVGLVVGWCAAACDDECSLAAPPRESNHETSKET